MLTLLIPSNWEDRTGFTVYRRLQKGPYLVLLLWNDGEATKDPGHFGDFGALTTGHRS